MVEYVRIRGTRYRVGDNGSVWSRKTRGWVRLKLSMDQDGYPLVCLYINGRKVMKRVHTLVLEAFVGPCPPGMEACHFPDRDPTNNNRDNLRWGTKKDNGEDRVKHGTARSGKIGEEHHKAKLTGRKVQKMRAAYKGRGRGPTIQSIADSVKVSYSAAWQAIYGDSWKHIT